MKKCTICKNNKALEEFPKYKLSVDGTASSCKKCKSEKAKQYRIDNKDNILEYYKKYRIENAEHIKNYMFNYNIENAEHIKAQKSQYNDLHKMEIAEKQKQYYNDNKEKLKEYIEEYNVINAKNIKNTKKIYYENNKQEIIKSNNMRVKQRMLIDPIFKMSMNLRTLIRNSFNRNFTKKSKKTADILGCTFEEFKIYLEKQFDDKMNWDNQGSYWHMDHIKPVSLATNEQELIELNHYTNFQPLEKYENLSKSNKY